jgi:hypothetical protein
MQRPGAFSSTNLKEPMLSLAEIDPLVCGSHSAGIAIRPDRKRPGHSGVFRKKPTGGIYDTAVNVVDGVIDRASGTFGVRLQLPTRVIEFPQASNSACGFNEVPQILARIGVGRTTLRARRKQADLPYIRPCRGGRTEPWHVCVRRVAGRYETRDCPARTAAGRICASYRRG